jgi:hypothetical protein
MRGNREATEGVRAVLPPVSYNCFLTQFSREKDDIMLASPNPTPRPDGTRRRRRLRRGAAVMALLGGLAVCVAACGGGSASPGVASVSTASTTPGAAAAQGGSSAANYADAVSYAKCMRAHGVGNFPDPASNGGFQLGGSGQANPAHAPAYSSASKACQHLLPNGSPLTPAQQQQIEAAALKYSQCVRAHGVLNFPDPDPNQPSIDLGGNESIDHNSPQFQAATKTCRAVLSSLPGGAPSGLPAGGPPAS